VTASGREAIDGIVLAGGKSSRFGSDKASAILRGRPLLQWVISALEPACARIVIVRALGQELPAVASSSELVVVEDRYVARGPLAGLVTGFSAVTAKLCFATACDAPLLQPELVDFLAGIGPAYDVVCPIVAAFHQPLTATYQPGRCAARFEELTARDQLRIVPAFEGLSVRFVAEDEVRAVDPELDSFRNANRPERLAEIEALLARRESLM
jgi:molybdenum cofactor guanylyltransferase